MKVESPERIWIESEGGCPYFYHEDELSDVGSPITEYVRADKLRAEIKALRAEVERDGARLDWLQQHDGRFYNLLRITSIVNQGFSPTNSGGKRWFSSIREAIDAAMRKEMSND